MADPGPRCSRGAGAARGQPLEAGVSLGPRNCCEGPFGPPRGDAAGTGRASSRKAHPRSEVLTCGPSASCTQLPAGVLPALVSGARGCGLRFGLTVVAQPAASRGDAASAGLRGPSSGSGRCAGDQRTAPAASSAQDPRRWGIGALRPGAAGRI